MKNILRLIQLNIKLFHKGKLLYMVIGSILVYTLYIQFGYANINLDAIKVLIYQTDAISVRESQSLIVCQSEQEIIDLVNDNENYIGFVFGEPNNYIYNAKLGAKNRNLLLEYARTALAGKSVANDIILIGENTRREKMVKEMTAEVLFFEIVAVGFLAVTSLLFHEKNQGISHVIGVLPIKIELFILIRLLVIALIDLAFAAILLVINLGPGLGLLYFSKVALLVTLLSLIMSQLGILLSHILKNFKQFGVVYVFLIVLITAPVFLVANTPVTFDAMQYNYFYVLYMNIKNVLFDIQQNNLVFYAISVFICAAIFMINNLFYKRSMQGE